MNSSEYYRKLTHLLNLALPLGYLYIIPEKGTFLGILALLLIVFVALDLGRMRVDWVRSLFSKLFDFMLRPHELEGGFTGATWVAIGAFLTVLFFPARVAILALLFMSLGDVAAALVGMKLGRTRVGAKSLEGFLAGLGVCLVLASLYGDLPWSVKIPGAVTAMVIELIPLPMDDNLLIPLGSGTIMVLISSLIA